MDHMNYCPVCGEKAVKGEHTCPHCHKAYDESKYMGLYRTGAGGVGYSKHTDDPSLIKKRKSNRLIGVIIITSIALIVGIVLAVMKVSLIASAAAALATCLIILIPYLISTRKKKDWEGTVEKKRTVLKHSRRRHYTIYEITFRTADGKKKVLKDSDPNARRFNYFQEGDRVRFIGSLNAYEKYDKSKDENVLCAGCWSHQDARNTYCCVCGARLLKGEPLIR